MAYKIVKYLFLIFFLIKISYAEIIYNKNNISITEIELKEYKNIFEQKYGIIPSDNQTIKNLVLLKKVIKFYEKNSPETLNLIDKKIGLIEVNDKALLDLNRNFLRLLVIKNEYILKYFREDFKKEDMKAVFMNMSDISYPISLDKCLTIDKLENLNDEDFFINSFYENLINNANEYKTQINSKIYDVCVDGKTYSYIEKEIINYIEFLSKNEFENFIYDKL